MDRWWVAVRARTLLLGLPLVLGSIASACAVDATEYDTRVEATSGMLTGTVVVYTVRFDETGENQYFLRRGKDELRLYFEQDPDLRPGTPLRVFGVPEDDGLRVDRFEVDEDNAVGVSAQPLIMGMKYNPRKFGFVLVDTGNGVNLTKEEAQKRMFGTAAGDKLGQAVLQRGLLRDPGHHRRGARATQLSHVEMRYARARDAR